MGASREEREMKRLLKEAGAVLIRQKKHHVYKLPSGKRIIVPTSGSDHRGIKNRLSLLRREINKAS